MKKNLNVILWVAGIVLFLALLFTRAVYPELLRLSVALGVAVILVLGGLVQQNRKALRSRTATYGLNAAVTVVLVLCIVGVLNFLAARYPQKLDLTQNKIHTLSDQTVKLVGGLDKTVKATFFGRMQQREEIRPLLDKYKALNPKFEVEYVDPDKEPMRTKQLGILKYGNLHLAVGERDSQIDTPTEEKLTNGLIKLLQDKSPVFCAITGHGEKSFTSVEPDGYEVARKGLLAQSYEVRELTLPQDLMDQKLPSACTAIAIMGSTKAFFPIEVEAIRTFLENGGRALVAIDLDLKGGAAAPDLLPVLEAWYVKPVSALIIDQMSQILGVDASVPVVGAYATDHPITKGFQGGSYFPLAMPLTILPAVPASLKVQWIGQTNPTSWGVVDLTQIAKGRATINKDKDLKGPLNVAVAIEGKQQDSQAKTKTRLVVFSSSHFAANQFSRAGVNQDFFMNSVSWIMEDDNLISIRAKEDGPGDVQLSLREKRVIFLITVVLIPFLIAIGGIVVWVIRRRL